MRKGFEERLQRRIQRLTLIRAIGLVASVAIGLALVAAILQWMVDPGINGLRNALWWAVVTVTTVGYGDIVPESTPGRIVGTILMLAGVSAIPVATSLVVSVFITRAQEAQRREQVAEREALIERFERIESALEQLLARK